MLKLSWTPKVFAVFSCATLLLIACFEEAKPLTSNAPAAGSKGVGSAMDTEAATQQGAISTSTTKPSADPAAVPEAPPVKPATPPVAIGDTLATGTTLMSFTPSNYTGAQYPAFVYAVWIANANGKYIKTVSARAATRIRFLDKWLLAAGVTLPTQPDGVAGASLNFPAAAAPVSFTWDMKDKAGIGVPLGNYTVNIQLTASNNTGLSLAVPIVISTTGLMKTDNTMTAGITAVSIKHTP